MHVFVYGTLRDPGQVEAVLGHAEFGADARLIGLHRVPGRYPTLAPGGETSGRLLRVGDGDLDALDAYEGVDRDLYVHVTVPMSDEAGACWIYVGDPGALNADVEWPGEGRFAARVRRYVERHPVRVER